MTRNDEEEEEENDSPRPFRTAVFSAPPRHHQHQANIQSLVMEKIKGGWTPVNAV